MRYRVAAIAAATVTRDWGLLDGNKRLAWVATRLFYVFNDHDLRRASLDEGEAFVVAIAAGHLDIPKIAETLARWTKDFDRPSPARPPPISSLK